MFVDIETGPLRAAVGLGWACSRRLRVTSDVLRQSKTNYPTCSDSLLLLQGALCHRRMKSNKSNTHKESLPEASAAVVVMATSTTIARCICILGVELSTDWHGCRQSRECIFCRTRWRVDWVSCLGVFVMGARLSWMWLNRQTRLERSVRFRRPHAVLSAAPRCPLDTNDPYIASSRAVVDRVWCDLGQVFAGGFRMPPSRETRDIR